MSFEHLLERVKTGGQLSKTELAAVCEELASNATREDPYTLVHILGKANAREARGLVERFLDWGRDDPEDDGMLRRIAVQVLASWWGLEEYFPVVADKAFNDPISLVRAVSATGIGHLGAVHRHLRSEAARLLLEGFNRREDEEQEVWEAFYEGMLELAGVEPAKWPYREHGIQDADIDREVVDKVSAIARASS